MTTLIISLNYLTGTLYYNESKNLLDLLSSTNSASNNQWMWATAIFTMKWIVFSNGWLALKWLGISKLPSKSDCASYNPKKR